MRNDNVKLKLLWDKLKVTKQSFYSVEQSYVMFSH